MRGKPCPPTFSTQYLGQVCFSKSLRVAQTLLGLFTVKLVGPVGTCPECSQAVRKALPSKTSEQESLHFFRKKCRTFDIAPDQGPAGATTLYTLYIVLASALKPTILQQAKHATSFAQIGNR